MSEIPCGNLYTMAQEEMKKVLPMNNYDLQRDLANIGAWFSIDMQEQYYMLLNRELSDYTVFNFLGMNYSKGVEELLEVLDGRGPVLQIDYNHDNKYFEIWVKYLMDNTPHMYILFPCSDFIIEI